MSTAYHLTPHAALAAAHATLMAAIQATEHPPGPLLHAAVEVSDALEAVADAEFVQDGGD